MIEVRNLHFAPDPSSTKHWHGGKRSVSNFYDALSIFFPKGERYFIASVRAFRESVSDPALAAAVKDFCAQEGMHSREHDDYNDRLRAHGYPIDELEGRVDWLLKRSTERLPRRMQLALTCALEHFTALLAQLVLEDPKVMEGAEPTMRALWRWHAAEELEHKSVAFDVFLAAGGTYRERAVGMTIAGLMFWRLVAVHQYRMMKADGTHTSVREWFSLLRYLFIRPGGLQRIILPALRYYRRDFHPREIDTEHLLAAWRADFKSSETYRRAEAA